MKVLSACRGFWQDKCKFTCTYEVVINGHCYEYTRQLPKNRRDEPPTAASAACRPPTLGFATRPTTARTSPPPTARYTGLVPIR